MAKVELMTLYNPLLSPLWPPKDSLNTPNDPLMTP